MRRSGHAALAIAACVLAFALVCGCARNDELVEYRVLAEHDGVRVELTVPLNEARSIGTYSLRVELQDGTTETIAGERDGMVSGLWLDDLDGDDVPEVVVGTTSSGSGSYGSLSVYRRDGDVHVLRALSPLRGAQSRGYMGRDEYNVQNGSIHRRFPTYLEGDSNAAPSGGFASLRYSFETDEWVSDAPLRVREEE